jgi:acyl transferase domain-containing protein
LKAKEVIIPDLAYTLQVGREAMASRLALVVQNREELIKGLKEYLKPDLVNTSGQTQIPVFSGELEENFTKADNLLFGEGTETFHKESRKDNTLEKLAEYWVRGGEVQWETLHIGKTYVGFPCQPILLKSGACGLI